MPTDPLQDAKATPGRWPQAGGLGLYLLRACGEGGGVQLVWKPRTWATGHGDPQHPERPPSLAAAWGASDFGPDVSTGIPGCHLPAGRVTPRLAEPPLGRSTAGTPARFPAPQRPGAWNSASALDLSRKGLEPTRTKPSAPSSFFPEPSSVPG